MSYAQRDQANPISEAKVSVQASIDAGKPPMPSSTLIRPHQDLSKSQIRKAGFNIISNRSGMDSQASQREAAHISSRGSVYSQAASHKEARFNRSLDVRDIIGPKKSHFGRLQAPTQNVNVFAGVRKGAHDTLSQHGGNFNKPSKNQSTAFSHLDMTQENYNQFLHNKLGSKVVASKASKEDPAVMIVAGMAHQAEPFKIADLLIDSSQFGGAVRRGTEGQQERRVASRPLQELPVAPQRNAENLIASREAGPTQFSTAMAPKTITLDQGYNRLFGQQAATESEATKEDPRKQGKRQYNAAPADDQTKW